MCVLGTTLTTAWLLGTFGVLGGLTLAVVAGKARRDIVESATARRRAHLDAGLSGSAAAEVVLDALRGSRWVQADLLQALRHRDPTAPTPTLGDEADRLLLRQATRREAGARGRAVLLAALLGRPVAVPLGRQLLDDRVGDVRLAACTALGTVATPDAAHALTKGLGNPAIAPARVIEQLAAPWAAPTVCDALEQLPDTRTRAAAVRAIGLSGHRPSAEAVVPLLISEDLEERIAAVRAVGELQDDAAAPLVRHALDDEAWEVRAQAARALGRLGAAEDAMPLAACMADANWWVRSNAADALAELGPAGRQALLDVTTQADRYAAERARQALNDLDQES